MSAHVRALTATLIAACPKPQRNTVAGRSLSALRGDVMNGVSKQPIRHVMRLMYGAIDAGSSVEAATQWLDDAKALVVAYAGRRERRQGSGVLPFDQLRDRVAVTAIKEDAEADVAECLADENDVASLEKARTERLEAIEAEERKVELLTNRIAFLRSR